MKVLIFTVLFATLFLSGFSQEHSQGIKGRVEDENGNPLQGASISIENTYLGTVSGKDGNYYFTRLHDGKYTLRFSFLGYKTLLMVVDLRGEARADIKMVPLDHVTEEVVVNATRAGKNTPLAYSVIDRDLLKRNNAAQDIPFLLGLTPSLVETSEAGNGVGYTSLRIRGTDANRINVTVDGIPLNDPESQQVFWVDLPDLASSVDNIQVQRGAGTSSNGAGAFGATISIQTLNPENDPVAAVTTSYGSFNTIKNTVSAGTGILNDRFAFMMRYSDIRSDGYIDRTGSKHRSAFLSGVFRTDRSRLKANIILGEEHTGIGWWGVPKDSLQTNRTYNPAGQYTDEYGQARFYDNESDNYRQDHYQLIYSLKMAEHINFNAALHYTKGQGYYEEYRDEQKLSDYQLDPFSSGTNMVSSSDLIRRKWLDNDFYGLVYSVSYKKDRLDLNAGGGLNRYSGDHYGTVIWMRTAGLSEKDFRWYQNNSLKYESSIYGKINYRLTGEISLFADLQLRSIHYRMLGIDDDLKDISQRHKFTFFNPKAGLFWSAGPNQDAWLSFSVANREPGREDFKEASGDPEATPAPERLYDIESGYKLRTERSSFSANLYGMFYKDQLVPTGQLSDVGYSIMTNVGKSYRIGVELSGALKLTGFLDWNTNLTLSRNKIINFVEYYNDYISEEDTTLYLSKNLGLRDIAYSPSQVWTNDLFFHKGVFGLHLISKFVGKQYFDNTMSEGRTIDPYFVNNLRIDFSPKIRNVKQVDMQLFVNNFLNKMYESNAYGGSWYEDGVENSWSYYFPQAGINWLVCLGFTF